MNSISRQFEALKGYHLTADGEFIVGEDVPEISVRRFTKTIPLYVPLAWLFYTEKGRVSTYFEKLKPNWLRRIASYLVQEEEEYHEDMRKESDLTEDDLRLSLINLLEMFYASLIKKTPKVILPILLYEVYQLFCYVQENLELDDSDLLSLAMFVSNSFLQTLEDSPVQLFNRQANYESFIEKYEALFLSESEVTETLFKDYLEREKVVAFFQDKESIETYLAEEEVTPVLNFSNDTTAHRVLEESYEFSILYKGEQVEKKHVLTVFDNLVCSSRVPYIMCIDDTRRRLSKLYTGMEKERTLKYEATILERKRGFKPYTIELTLWLGAGEMETSKYNSFFRAVIDFNQGKMRIKILKSSTANYMSRLNNIVFGKDITIGERILTSFSADFEVRPPPNSRFSLKEFVLIDTLYNPLFKYSFYTSDRSMPVSKRKILKFKYTPYMNREFCDFEGDAITEPLSWSLSEKYKEVEEGVETKLRVYISKVKNDEVLKAFVDEFTFMIECYHFATLYGDIQSEVELPESLVGISVINDSYLKLFLTDVWGREREWRRLREKTGVVTREKKIIDTSSGTQHRYLVTNYGQVFGSNFSRFCPGKRVPYVYTKTIAEAEAKKNEKLFGSYIAPMPFPPQSPLFWVVSDNAKYPYPTVIENLDPETRANYPFVPSCTINSDRGHLYKTLYSDEEDEGVSKTTVYVHKKEKFLRPGVSGEMELKFAEILGTGPLIRFGTSKYPSQSSLLSCMLYIEKDEKFMGDFITSGTESALAFHQLKREAYILERRKKLRFSYETVAQELYGYTPEQAEEAFRTGHLDAQLFYRIFEELYDVNIFVFSNKATKVTATSRVGRVPQLEIPRYSVFHCRERRLNRPTVILLRNYGPLVLSGLRNSPHYELVQEAGEFFFGDKVTKTCYDLLESVHNVAVWMPSPSGEIKAYRGLSFQHSFALRFRRFAVSQIIDTAGYLRVINFKYENIYMSVFVLPAQPLEGVPNITEYTRCDGKLALTAFAKLGKPTSVAVTKNKVSGFWFSYKGVPEGLFVPIKLQAMKGYKEGAPDPFGELEAGNSTVRNIEKAKREANFMKELLIWLWILYKKREVEVTKVQEESDSDEDSDFEEVIVRRTIMRKVKFVKKVDQTSLINSFLEYIVLTVDDRKYDFTKLAEILPEVEFSGALEYIGDSTNFVENGKIVCYNEDLYKKIVYFVKDYARSTEGLVQETPPRIRGYYTRDIFESNENAKLFLDQKELKLFVSEIDEISRMSLEVKTIVKNNLCYNKFPYIVRTDEGHFIVQNVRGGSDADKRALTNAYTWYKNRINTGYDVNLLEYAENREEIKGMLVAKYALLISGTIGVIHNPFTDLPNFDIEQHKEKIPYLRILVYGNLNDIEHSANLWAALLPI